MIKRLPTCIFKGLVVGRQALFSILCLFLLCFCTQTFAQETQTVKLLGFTPSSCDQGEEADRIQSRIISQQFKGDVFYIEVATTANCCSRFTPAVVWKNGVLNLTFNETNRICACSCSFQFVYKIAGLKSKNFVVHLNGKRIQLTQEKYVTYPVTYELLGKDTINYRDKYGFAQGLHITGKDKSKPEELVFIKDDFYQNGSVFIEYYPNGHRKSALRYQDEKEFWMEYHENGRVRLECGMYAISLRDSLKIYTELCLGWDSLGIPTQNSCLVDTCDQQKVYVFAFVYDYKKGNKIFVNFRYEITEEGMREGIQKLAIPLGTPVRVCLEKGINPLFVEKIRMALTLNGLNRVEVKEFERKP